MGNIYICFIANACNFALFIRKITFLNISIEYDLVFSQLISEKVLGKKFKRLTFTFNCQRPVEQSAWQTICYCQNYVSWLAAEEAQ